MPRFKADMHIHNCFDYHELSTGLTGMMSPYKIIDIAHEHGYQILSFTHHGAIYYDEHVTSYASKKGVILIPGAEAFINKKHVLLYNFDNIEEIDSFDKLKEKKNKNNLVIAPHPFYPAKCCLKLDLISNIDCFDAIEYSHFYTLMFNPNKQAQHISDIHNKTIVGFSDTHFRNQFNTTYSLIDADNLSVESVIQAIRKGYVEVVTTPLNITKFANICFRMSARINLLRWKKTKTVNHTKNQAYSETIN